MTRNRIRKSGKVGEKESVTGKLVPEDVEQLEEPSRDEFRLGKIGSKRKRGPEATEYR